MNEHTKDIWKGIGIVLLLHGVLLIFPITIFFIGFVQVIYIIPAVVIALMKRKTAIAQGILIAAGITFLVNTACFGVFMMGWY
ncbi:hypothetical protein Q4O60_00435 [Aeribacillus pallidus]|nr:hypothetical protein [Aeribacillus pallidus]